MNGAFRVHAEAQRAQRFPVGRLRRRCGVGEVLEVCGLQNIKSGGLKGLVNLAGGLQSYKHNPTDLIGYRDATELISMKNSNF